MNEEWLILNCDIHSVVSKRCFKICISYLSTRFTREMNSQILILRIRKK